MLNLSSVHSEKFGISDEEIDIIAFFLETSPQIDKNLLRALDMTRHVCPRTFRILKRGSVAFEQRITESADH